MGFNDEEETDRCDACDASMSLRTRAFVNTCDVAFGYEVSSIFDDDTEAVEFNLGYVTSPAAIWTDDGSGWSPISDTLGIAGPYTEDISIEDGIIRGDMTSEWIDEDVQDEFLLYLYP